MSDEMSREEMARKVREVFPACAAFAAAMADEFHGTRMVFASENGQEIGKRGPDGVPVVLDRVGEKGKPAEPVAGAPRRSARQIPLQGGAVDSPTGRAGGPSRAGAGPRLVSCGRGAA